MRLDLLPTQPKAPTSSSTEEGQGPQEPVLHPAGPGQINLGSLPNQPEPIDTSEFRAAPDYGTRADGTPKGQGFFGELERPDGGVSTELSIGVQFDGHETEIPTLVPTLDKEEADYLLGGGKPTEEIIQKAVDHAKTRIAEGKSPFAQYESEGFGIADIEFQTKLYTDRMMLGVYGREGLQELADTQKKVNFFMSRAPRIAMAYAAPVAALLYEVLDQGTSAIVSKIKGDKYDPFERRMLAELIPEEAPTALKVAGALGETLAHIALIGGAINLAKQGTLSQTVKELTLKMQREGIDISKGRVPTKPEILQASKGTSLEKAAKMWMKAKKINLRDLMRKQVTGGPKIEGPVNGKAIQIIKPGEVGPNVVAGADGMPLTMGIDKVSDIANLPPKVVETSVELSLTMDEEIVYMNEIKGEIKDGEAGYRMQKEDGEFIGVGSTYPDYFKNKGYTAKFAMNAIDKFHSGKPLGVRQQEFIEDMKDVMLDKKARDAEYAKEEAAALAEDAEERAAIQGEEPLPPKKVIDYTKIPGLKPEGPKYPTKPTHMELITAQNRTADLLGVKKFTEPLERAKMMKDMETLTLRNEIARTVKGLKELNTVTTEQMAVALNTSVEAPKRFGEKEKAVFDYFRTLTREMLARTNEVRVATGRDPINDVGAYFRHLVDISAQEILAGKVPLPQKLQEWGEKNITGQVRNPMELERKLKDELLKYFSKDLAYVMSSMINTALKEIHFAMPKQFLEEALLGEQIDPEVLLSMDPKEKAAFLAETEEMPNEVKNWMEEYIKVVILDEKQTTLDQKTNQWLAPDTPVAKWINKKLEPFGRQLSERAFTDLLVAASKLPLYGVIGGLRPKLLLRNKMQVMQNIALYGVSATIKGTRSTADYPGLEELKAKSLFLKSYSGIEDMPAGAIDKMSKIMMASFQWSALSNVNQAMNTAYHWVTAQIEDPLRADLGWADPQRTYTEESGFKYPSEEQIALKEMEYGAQTAQYQYIGQAMPGIFKYKTLAPLTRLQSWWMNHWAVFIREAATRAITGRVGYTIDMVAKGAGPNGEDIHYTKQPKLSPASRLNFLKWLVIAGVTLNTLGYGRSYLFGTAPTGVPPAAQLAWATYMYFMTDDNTPYNANKKREYGRMIKQSAMTFIPGYLTVKDFTALISGEKPVSEYLFYNKGKEEVVAPF